MIATLLQVRTQRLELKTKFRLVQLTFLAVATVAVGGSSQVSFFNVSLSGVAINDIASLSSYVTGRQMSITNVPHALSLSGNFDISNSTFSYLCSTQ